MKYITCLILSLDKNRINTITDIVDKTGLAHVKTTSIMEFIQAMNFYLPECIIIDMQSFDYKDVIKDFLFSEKSLAKRTIILCDEPIDSFRCLKLDKLRPILEIKKNNILKENLLVLPKLKWVTAEKILRHKLLECGFLPKYKGFMMLIDTIIISSIYLPVQMYKNIYPIVACKHKTSVTAVTQCLRKIVEKRDTSIPLPFDQFTLKQIVSYLVVLVRSDLAKLMDE